MHVRSDVVALMAAMLNAGIAPCFSSLQSSAAELVLVLSGGPFLVYSPVRDACNPIIILFAHTCTQWALAFEYADNRKKALYMDTHVHC
jgi:hypothetical protein